MNLKGTTDGNVALNLDSYVHQIQSRKDFLTFLRALHYHLTERPGEWENRDLGSFLEALAAWVEDMDGFYQNAGEAVPGQPTWKTLGQMLLAARVYE